MVEEIILYLTTLLTAINVGIFYAWSITVIPGTKKIDDRSYVLVMQSINREILNPPFFIVFLGSPLLLIISSIVLYNENVGIYVIAAALFVVVGLFLVTGMGNVPLNNRLEAEDLSALSDEAAKSIREWFEGPWNRLQHIRSFASLIGLFFLLYALQNFN